MHRCSATQILSNGFENQGEFSPLDRMGARGNKYESQLIYYDPVISSPLRTICGQTDRPHMQSQTVNFLFVL